MVKPSILIVEVFVYNLLIYSGLLGWVKGMLFDFLQKKHLFLQDKSQEIPYKNTFVASLLIDINGLINFTTFKKIELN